MMVHISKEKGLTFNMYIKQEKNCNKFFKERPLNSDVFNVWNINLCDLFEIKGKLAKMKSISLIFMLQRRRKCTWMKKVPSVD